MGNSPSTTDILGFSNRDKKSISHIWRLLDADKGKLGLALFIQFFADHPEHTKYYKFLEFESSDMNKNPLLRLHAARVMTELSFCVENISKDDVLLHTLRRNALRHRSRRIAKKAYDDFRRTFLKVLCRQYQNQFTMDMAELLNKALKILFNVLTDVNEGVVCTCANNLLDSPSTSQR